MIEATEYINKVTTTKKTHGTMKLLHNIAGDSLSLSRLLYAERKDKGLTQIDFANMLDVPHQHYCQIERGVRDVSSKMAADFAKVLGYSAQYFVRLALQDALDREGLDFIVELKGSV